MKRWSYVPGIGLPMRTAQRALALLLRPREVWADIAAGTGADRPLLIGHALLLLALVGYVLTVRLFRSGTPVLLPPRPEEAERYGRIIGRRAMTLGLALPILALVAAAFALIGQGAPPGLPAIAT